MMHMLFRPEATRPDLVPFAPAVDVEETQSQYLFAFDLPGVKKEDVKIELNANQLLVTGARKPAYASDDARPHFTERPHGEFQRAFTLPNGIDNAKVEAAFEDGVLRITVPKAENAKPRRIPIGSTKLA